ncbi:MAG: hypothetical protein PSX37_13330, partial [bacterium]|nr:hypothetical protein [bacterium]
GGGAAKAVSDAAQKANDAATSAVEGWQAHLQSRLDKARDMALSWRSRMIGLLSIDNAFALANDKKAQEAEALKGVTDAQKNYAKAQQTLADQTARQQASSAAKAATDRVNAELEAEANARKYAGIADPVERAKQMAADVAAARIKADAAARLAAASASDDTDPLAGAREAAASAADALASAQSVYQDAAAKAAVTWVDTFRAQMSQASNFIGLLSQLKASGAGQTLIDQIAGLGPEAGAQAAQDLINGGPGKTGLIGSFNAGFAAFDSQATALGVNFANSWAQETGPKLGGLTAQKMVNRFENMLTGDGIGKKRLDAIMDNLASDLSRTIELTVHMNGSSVVSVDGHRALGGPVSAGKTYWVGENGPEPFIPGSDGYVFPHGSLDNASAASRAAAVSGGAQGNGPTADQIERLIAAQEANTRMMRDQAEKDRTLVRSNGYGR